MAEEKKKAAASCDYCSNLVYDEELEDYVCDAILDEDDIARLYGNKEFSCPYFRADDDYKLARRQ